MPEETLPAENGTLEHLLRQPIDAHGEPVKKLVFREPRAADAIRIGNPVHIDTTVDPVRITFDDEKFSRMMAHLAGVPTSSIAQMSMHDFTDCEWKLSGFFLSGSVEEQIKDALRLALIFRTSPFPFLDQPASVLTDLVRYVTEVLPESDNGGDDG